jgi:hypothetical protein
MWDSLPGADFERPSGADCAALLQSRSQQPEAKVSSLVHADRRATDEMMKISVNKSGNCLQFFFCSPFTSQERLFAHHILAISNQSAWTSPPSDEKTTFSVGSQGRTRDPTQSYNTEGRAVCIRIYVVCETAT